MCICACITILVIIVTDLGAMVYCRWNPSGWYLLHSPATASLHKKDNRKHPNISVGGEMSHFIFQNTTIFLTT